MKSHMLSSCGEHTMKLGQNICINSTLKALEKCLLSPTYHHYIQEDMIGRQVRLSDT